MLLVAIYFYTANTWLKHILLATANLTTAPSLLQFLALRKARTRYYSKFLAEKYFTDLPINNLAPAFAGDLILILSLRAYGLARDILLIYYKLFK
jgi:hypothetical protein